MHAGDAVARAAIHDLKQLLQEMNPRLESGVFVFCRIAHDAEVPLADIVALFREIEGVTLIVPEAIAIERGWRVLFRAAWIVLQVPSDLLAVGFLAVVSGELAQHGISCNPVSAACHDHLFVPYDVGTEALRVLLALQARHRAIDRSRQDGQTPS